ncbi:MAG: AtpZ/AtpI family protein [Candidatus Nomurabacteria bacterium]|nr:AtpZ/AtpI family protein [Candidatus Nomurabacteria bacterium]
MAEIENNKRQTGPWWKPAVEIFSEISTWIIVPIVLALVGGKALDAHYGTKPIIFLSLAGFGFLITCFGIFRIVKNYMKKLKEIEKKN